MFTLSFYAPSKPRSPTSLALSVAAATALVFAACDAGAAALPTAARTSAAVVSSPTTATLVAPVKTPTPERPPGVADNATPFAFGCTADVARCQDIAPGTYYTAGTWALLPGLTFTLPAGWSSLANEAGELELHRTGDDHNEIMVWRDVVPWHFDHASLGQPPNPDEWIDIFQGNPCLLVSAPERVVIGDWIDLRDGGKRADLEAIALSVGVARKAVWEAAGCPDSGQVVIMADPMHWANGFNIGGDEMTDPGCPCSSLQRLYFASFGYVSHQHLLVVALQSYGPNGDVDAAMTSLQAAAQPILDSLVAPAIVVDN